MLERTERGQQGFGSTGTSKAQICEISAKAFRKFYRKPDTTTGILKYHKKEGCISLESVNLSTELAIKSGKYQNQRKLAEMVPQEYHKYLDVFEKGEKTKLPHQQKKRLLQMDRHCVQTQEIRLEHPVCPVRPHMAPAQWLHPSPLGAIQPASCPPTAPGWSISHPNLPKKRKESDPYGSALGNTPCP